MLWLFQCCVGDKILVDDLKEENHLKYGRARGSLLEVLPNCVLYEPSHRNEWYEPITLIFSGDLNTWDPKSGFTWTPDNLVSGCQIVMWLVGPFKFRKKLFEFRKVSKIRTKSLDIGFFFRTDFRWSLESIWTKSWILDIFTSKIWRFCSVIRWNFKSKLLFPNLMALDQICANFGIYRRFSCRCRVDLS